ncbi:MAG: shikimate dehydrogenase [Methylotenera sp.]|nr:shikimate dehydrogenase [Flavobacterium sp.]
MKRFGLIGFPLTHSFSKKYFSAKFEKENISDCAYENYEILEIEQFTSIIKNNPDLKGLNVTIPYKQQVLPYLDSLDVSAEFVGAVNVIKIGSDKKLKGYNSDYYGFLESLKRMLPEKFSLKALILGTGGAAKAVEGALKTLKIEYQYVSRQKDGILSYAQLTKEVIEDHKLIINTSPLGMSPKTDTFPDIDYSFIGQGHFLFDLVYNPEVTLFMQKGIDQGASVKNGLEMLHLQAEEAWKIWNS